MILEHVRQEALRGNGILFIKILCERPRSLGRGGIARQPDVKVALVLASSLVSYLELILMIAIAITPLNKLTMLV